MQQQTLLTLQAKWAFTIVDWLASGMEHAKMRR